MRRTEAQATDALMFPYKLTSHLLEHYLRWNCFYLWPDWEASTIHVEYPVSQYSNVISCPMDSKSTEGVAPCAILILDEMGSE